MIKPIQIMSVIGVFGLFLTSCNSSSGGGGGGTTGTGTTSAISTTAEGAAATGAGTASANAGTALAEVGSSLGSLGGSSLGAKPMVSKPARPLAQRDPKYAGLVRMAQKVGGSLSMQKAATRLKTARSASRTAMLVADISFTENCSLGGTVTFDGTFDTDTGAVDLTLVLNNCREEDELIDGTMSMSGTISLDETAFGNDMTLMMTFDSLTFQAYEEGVLQGTFVMNLTIDQSLSSSGAETSFNESYTQTLAGTMTFDEAGPGGANLSVTVDNLGIVGSFSVSGSTVMFDDTINGDITQSYSEGGTTHSVAIGYDDFTMTGTGTETFFSSGLSALSHDPAGSFDITFDGSVTTDFTPDEDCDIEGTFVIVTLEPLHIGDEASCPVSGHLSVNGDTDAVFNADGSVDVTVGGETTHYESCDDLEGLCEIEDFEL